MPGTILSRALEQLNHGCVVQRAATGHRKRSVSFSNREKSGRAVRWVLSCGASYSCSSWAAAVPYAQTKTAPAMKTVKTMDWYPALIPEVAMVQASSQVHGEQTQCSPPSCIWQSDAQQFSVNVAATTPPTTGAMP